MTDTDRISTMGLMPPGPTRRERSFCFFSLLRNSDDDDEEEEDDASETRPASTRAARLEGCFASRFVRRSLTWTVARRRSESGAIVPTVDAATVLGDSNAHTTHNSMTQRAFMATVMEGGLVFLFMFMFMFMFIIIVLILVVLLAVICFSFPFVVVSGCVCCLLL